METKEVTINGEKLELTFYDNGDQIYRNQADQLHNPVGPAVIYSDGYKAYWLNGKRHNEDGPAIIYPDGSEEYWLNGELHNEDGPAVIESNGYKSYWLNDKPFSKEEWEKQVKIKRL